MLKSVLIKITKVVKKSIGKLFKLSGRQVIKIKDPIIDEDKKFVEIMNKCRKFTMISKERMYSLYKSVKYIVNTNISGDFVECGVWRGGSAMLIVLTLLEMGVTDRKIYLYDTYTGMVKPTKEDTFVSSNYENNAIDIWNKNKKKNYNEWLYSSLDEVKNNMASTGYPQDNYVFIKGKVEETIPKTIPSEISLLRLDTDFYTSTKHELINLFPLLIEDGVLIIDDYGFMKGAKKAVDEYFLNKQILLNRIDVTGLVGVKNEN